MPEQPVDCRDDWIQKLEDKIVRRQKEEAKTQGKYETELMRKWKLKHEYQAEKTPLAS